MNNPLIRFEPKWPLFVTVVALGLLLRLFGLGHQSLWLDEMTSIQVAERPLSQIMAGQGFDNHTPPFYYILLHFWGQFVPLTEFGLRLLSVCIDVSNMLFLGLLCRRFVSAGPLLLVVSAYAFSPFMLYYAQEGRMYTLAVLFALLYTSALERLVRAERRLVLWTLLGGVVLALGVYTHYYLAFYACAVSSAALFAVRRCSMRIAAIVSSGLLGLLLFAPWIPVAIQLAGSEGQTFRTFIFSVIPYTIFRFMIGYAVFPLNMHTKEHFVSSAIAHAPYLIAVFGALLLLGSSLLHRNNLRNGVMMAGGWVLLVPIIIGLLASMKVPMLSERYLIVSFPAFLLICLGFQDLTRKWSIVAIGLFFILLLVGDLAYFFNPNFGKAQWRDVAGYVERTLDRNGIVLVEPDYATPVFQYYFHGPQAVYALQLTKLESAQLPTESYLPLRFVGHRRVVLVTSGPVTPDSGYAKVLARYAEKTQTEVFELETGITCTTWEIASDKNLDQSRATVGGLVDKS